MTEDKAKTKWCPMVRWSTGPVGGTASVNMIHDAGGNPLRAKCIASGCMMWRQHRGSNGRRMNTGYCGIGGVD